LKKILNIEWKYNLTPLCIDPSKVSCEGKLYSQVSVKNCDAALAMSYTNHRGTRRTVYFSTADIAGFLRVVNQLEIV